MYPGNSTKNTLLQVSDSEGHAHKISMCEVRDNDDAIWGFFY